LAQGETHSPAMLGNAAANTPQEDGDDNSSWIQYALFGAGGLCILCGLGAFLVHRRRKGPSIAEFFNAEEKMDCDTDAMDGMDVPAGNTNLGTSTGLIGHGGYGKLTSLPSDVQLTSV